MQNIPKLSEDLLLAVKLNAPTSSLVSLYGNLAMQSILQNLKNDTNKNAFWINTYNAFFQILSTVNKLEKKEIYINKVINIGGEKFSLDDIEHGILRKYRYKKSLGYFPNLFAPKLIRALAVENVDYRIHFALNCGAKSCPPIAFYSPNKLDQQLEMATLSFLESETEIDDILKEIHVTRLFLWFIADFGGKKGIKQILKSKLDINTSGYTLKFKSYSWDKVLANYID